MAKSSEKVDPKKVSTEQSPAPRVQVDVSGHRDPARDSALSRAVQQIEKQFGKGALADSHMGIDARLMGHALRKLTAAIAKSRTTVIFINQIREKIGVMFGNPETTPGGRALKFYASVRIDVRRTQTIKEGDVSIGSRTRARVVKNKIAPPFRDAEFDIMFDRGISYEGDLVDLAALGNIVENSGAWYTYKGRQLGQGGEK